eukprot:Gregarina_sp_Poly_1__4733@NODE_2529_length_2021_cov_67_477994_g1247_i1_p2_GENE_NODE_2529_length_2021_cov_67_477994_g1247_i1NODE_2529_length_2021_cov_67_477994_g1247_i1_p2_ORF_typecomplete_len156_score26_83GCP_N_terminal/PF17681_1/0_084Mod_r/PF07200_13/5_3e03Mod_r/PF07200_13/0_057_NODE_2529_length_2021_cov_67_477994_g1247_i1416883
MSLNNFVTKYFDLNALLETKRTLQIINTSREVATGVGTAEVAPNRIINEQKLIKDVRELCCFVVLNLLQMERDHDVVIDALYSEVSEQLPRVTDVVTLDTETAKSLAKLQADLMHSSNKLSFLRCQTLSGMSSLASLTNNVENQTKDLKQILALL